MLMRTRTGVSLVQAGAVVQAPAKQVAAPLPCVIRRRPSSFHPGHLWCSDSDHDEAAQRQNASLPGAASILQSAPAIGLCAFPPKAGASLPNDGIAG